MPARRAGWAASFGAAETRAVASSRGQADQVLVGEQSEQAQDRCVTRACGPVTQRVFRTLRNRTRRSSAT